MPHLVQALPVLRQWLNVLNRLLEDDTILVLDRDIFHLAVSFVVTCAVVLDLYDDASNFAQREVEHILHDRRVLAAST